MPGWPVGVVERNALYTLLQESEVALSGTTAMLRSHLDVEGRGITDPEYARVEKEIVEYARHVLAQLKHVLAAENPGSVEYGGDGALD